MLDQSPGSWVHTSIRADRHGHKEPAPKKHEDRWYGAEGLEQDTRKRHAIDVPAKMMR